MVRKFKLKASHCTFFNNRAEQSGGAIKIEAAGHALLEGCRIDSNFAARGQGQQNQGGGGIILSNVWNTTIDSCVLVNNIAGPRPGTLITIAGKGGGMRVQKVISLTIRKTLFLSNKAQGRLAETVNANGGGLHMEQGDVILDTCTLTQNTAINQGGGIWADVSSWTANYGADGVSGFKLEGTVINANTALSGGGLYIARDQNNQSNTIAWITSSCMINNQVCCGISFAALPCLMYL